MNSLTAALSKGERRLIELYRQGLTLEAIADDKAIGQSLLAGTPALADRRWTVWQVSEMLLRQGHMPRQRSNERERAALTITDQRDALAADVADLETIANRQFSDRELAVYEHFAQLSARRTMPRRPPTEGRVEYVVIGDPHVPDERPDLIEEICRRHNGAHCVIAGDLNDWEKYSRFEKEGFDQIGIQHAFARTDALVEQLSTEFASVTLMFGNHDMRIPKALTNALGPDFHWLGHTFLVNAYQNRHGAYLVDNHIVKANGRIVQGVHYYHQLGDCLVSHAETCGSTPSKGVMLAAKHFRQFDAELGLDPFRVVLQAHTHKRSYYYDPLVKAHCFEIGAVCDTGVYAFRKQTYGPVQRGYFHLIQEDGVTQVDESRLYSFEQ